MLDEMKTAAPGTTIWDKGEKASVKGLHLRVAADGKKTFYLYYRTRDTQQQRRPKIGLLGDITLSEARRRAGFIMDQVSIGLDPKGEWDVKRAEMSVQELFEAAWKGYWNAPRFQMSGWGKEANRLYQREIAPTFKSLKLSEVTAVRVRNWHASYAATPYTGNRALSVLARMFRFAEEQEIRKQHSNPCNLVKYFPERKRKRYASKEEIARIFEALEKRAKQRPTAVAFLYLLIFTGSRPRAIERATWEQLKEFEIDGQKYGMLTLEGKATAKTGQEDTVILPPQAMKALNRLPRVEGWTITGINIPSLLWREIRKEAGCEDLWARDWRRTFATVGNSNGMSMSVIGEVLNHRSTQTTKTYAKVLEDKKLETVAAIANQIEAYSQVKQG